MAKKAHNNRKRPQHAEQKTGQAVIQEETKSGHALKEMLSDAMLQKLKGVVKDLKAEKEKEAQAEVDRRRKEAEEREKNKSFADLLVEYDKKGGGKYT